MASPPHGCAARASTGRPTCSPQPARRFPNDRPSPSRGARRERGRSGARDRQRSRARAMDRLRSDQLLAERPDRRARAAAGQQRNPEPGEPGHDADQPGRNLASLPYSSLAQLEQSITQTEQLLAQAQRIAYSVTTIDQAFTQTYPQSLFELDRPASSCSPTRRPAGRTRSPASRTPCACRPASCRTSTAPARRSMR